jgi:hypothetical protein
MTCAWPVNGIVWMTWPLTFKSCRNFLIATLLPSSTAALMTEADVLGCRIRNDGVENGAVKVPFQQIALCQP